MSTEESSTGTVPMEDKKVEPMAIEEGEPKELTPPLTELIRELWMSISVPFSMCCRAQRWSLGVAVLAYVLYTLCMVGWPRYGYRLVSSYCDPQHPQWTEDITYRQQTPGGYLKDNIIFPPEATWKYQDYVRGCPCKVKSCVRKCCPTYEIYQSRENLTCVEVKNGSSIFNNLDNNLYTSKGLRNVKHFYRENLKKSTRNQTEFKVVSGYSDCGKYLGVLGARYQVLKRTATLMEDGTALTEDGVFLDIDDYCIENTLQEDSVITVRCVKINLMHHPRFWTLKTRPFSEWIAIGFSYCAFLATIFTFIFVPQLRNVHGAMLIGFVVFQGVNFSQYLFDLDKLSPNLAYLWQFSYLAMFCWMTCFGVDLWLFFCGDMRARTTKMVSLYALCATGLPMVLTALTWVVGVVPEHSHSCSTPRFEDDHCTFTVERTTRLFLYVPVVLMLLLNLLLSMSISYNMNRVLQDTSGKPFLLSPCGRPHDTARQGFCLYSKVFKVVILIGICLLILTTPFSQESPFFHHHISLLFYYQGFLLFLVIICDRQFFKPFYARFLEVNIKMEIAKQEKKAKKRQKEQEEYEKYQEKKRREEIQREMARQRPA